MRVLIADDERLLADTVADGLRRLAMAVDVCYDGAAAIERLSVNDYDVAVLDRDMPHATGDAVCSWAVRSAVGARILILTAAAGIRDRVDGLALGADDYLTKPFAFAELAARVHTLARRPPTGTPPVLDRFGVVLDVPRHRAFRDGRLLDLTPKEFAVLSVLMHRAGEVVSAEELLEKAWDEHADPFTNAVRVAVMTLRRKLGDPPLLHTVPRVGYRLGTDAVRLTPRRRAVIAVLVSWPFAWVFLYWAFFTAVDLLRYFHSSLPSCTHAWESLLNSCNDSYSPILTVVELVAVTSVMVLGVYGLARWVLHPVRAMAESVRRFGPNSLGLRLTTTGPRDETRQVADEIDRMLDRLAEGYDAQRRFASNASHELRTPLATQRALIEVSLGSALTLDQLALLARQLLATNERNERLVDGLLTLAETEGGLRAHTAVRLDDVVRETVDGLQATAAERGVHLALDLAPATVRGEAPLLDRLVSNLVGNAVKYNLPAGRVDVRVGTDPTLSVINTGPQVPGDEVAGLFEPFRRLNGERLDHGGGAGLGLTIARSIVAAHTGSIDARANAGGGLTVSVRLPPAP